MRTDKLVVLLALVDSTTMFRSSTTTPIQTVVKGAIPVGENRAITGMLAVAPGAMELTVKVANKVSVGEMIELSEM